MGTKLAPASGYVLCVALKNSWVGLEGDTSPLSLTPLLLLASCRLYIFHVVLALSEIATLCCVLSVFACQFKVHGMHL